MTQPPSTPEPPAPPAAPKGQAFPGPAPTPAPTDAGGSETEGWWPQRPVDRWGDFNSRHRWAARLAFPLMVVAVLLAWKGVQVSSGEEASALPGWAWWLLAAGAAFGGLLMVRMRNRSMRPPNERLHPGISEPRGEAPDQDQSSNMNR